MTHRKKDRSGECLRWSDVNARRLDLRKSLAISAVAILSVSSICSVGFANGDEQLDQAIEWASQGNVEPYPLLALGPTPHERPRVGSVYTPLVRLAMAVQSAMRTGQAIEQVPREPKSEDVLITWESEPDFSPQSVESCSDGSRVKQSLRMGLRPFQARRNFFPFQKVSFDEAANANVIRKFRTGYDGRVWAVARVQKSELRPESLLVLAAGYRCPDGPTVTRERFAYISAEDLRRWR